jgi:hypothetical protein
MRRAFLPIVLCAACGSVPIDDTRNDKRLFVPRGVIRGTVTYQGPRPCTRAGHVIGSAVILVFDRRNPPPPRGIAVLPENFVAVPGDLLFSNEPRSQSSEVYCPKDSGNHDVVSVSAPFAVAPLDAGSYVIQAFYDYTGNFLPTFKFRNLPEAGDLGGGYIDVADALRNAENPSYQPKLLEIDVGIPSPLPEGVSPDAVPEFTMPKTGFVADNVPVTIGAPIGLTRPYFHVEGAERPADAPLVTPENATGDPSYVPVLQIPQDVHVAAPPQTPSPQSLAAYQASFPNLRLAWGVPQAELASATDPVKPFRMQIAPGGGLHVFATGEAIPENPAVAALWPLVVLTKLVSDPAHRLDPQSVVTQGDARSPIVVLQGITLADDSFARTIAAPPPATPGARTLRDHVTAMIRPAALCFDARAVDAGAVLVTPYLKGKPADGAGDDRDLFDGNAVRAQRLVRDVRIGCLPTGRYAINAVYPTGQAWTVPNEAGSCAASEGPIDFGVSPPSCAKKSRPVLYSQGTRAVVEIVEPATDEGRAYCNQVGVPPECLPQK